MSYEISAVKQSELTEDILRDIIFLKNQYWVHPYESQKRWIEENLDADDIHLLMKSEGKPIAYLSICRVVITIDQEKRDMLGIGSVCVGRDFAGKGLGRAIVLAANELIKGKGEDGALLCHDALVGFYGRIGWSLLKYKTATLAEKPYCDNVMLLREDEIQADSVLINKNF